MCAARRDLLQHVAFGYFRAETLAGNLQMNTIAGENLSRLILGLPDNRRHNNLTSTNGEPHSRQCTQDSGDAQNGDHQDNAGPTRKLASALGWFFGPFDLGFLHTLQLSIMV